MAFSSSSSSKSKKKSGCASTVIAAIFIILVVKWLWPATIPFSLFQFWPVHGSLDNMALAALGIFAIGTVISILDSIVYRRKLDVDPDVRLSHILAAGTVISLLAGVLEEISFRWLLFYSAIVGYIVANWLFFGFAGFGISQWLFVHIFGPIVDTITFHNLHQQLYSYGWAVGAALISTNGKFRDGHSYQGILGWINAWIGGIFLFYIMFNYGLPIAILVHFLYDLYCFILIGIGVAISRSRSSYRYY